MNTDYTIKNFRVFDKNGVTAKIRPITILTGCNSSGKSSIVKSMVLFQNYIKDVCQDYSKSDYFDLKNNKLDFSRRPSSSLGNFTKVLNKHSDSHTITYTATCHSLLLGEDLHVTFEFGLYAKDDLKDGYLKKFVICDQDDNVIFSSSEVKYQLNFNLIAPSFFRFVYGQYLIYLYRVKLGDNKTNKEDVKLWKKIEKRKKDFDKIYGRDAICDIRKWCDITMPYAGIILNAKEQYAKTGVYLVDFCNGDWNQVIPETDIHTVFYVPILEELKDAAPNNIDQSFKVLTDNKEYDKSYDFILKRVINSFKNNGANTFIEYFNQLEKEALNYRPEKNRCPNNLPCVFDPRFFHVHSHCMEDSKIFSGPSKIELEDGSVEYMHSEEGIGQWLNKPIAFADLISLLTYLNNINSSQATKSYNFGFGELNSYNYLEHNAFAALKQYAVDVIKECIYRMPRTLSYVGSSLVNIKRFYSMESNDEFTDILKEYFEAKRKFNNDGGIMSKPLFNPGTFINKWFKAFDIADHVEMKVNDEGLGVSIRVYDSPDDEKGELLADQGYGVTQLFVILLRIEIAIMNSIGYEVVKDKHALYDVSAHWVLEDGHLCTSKEGALDSEERDDIEILYSSSTLAIEEPEIHQHPKFQSLLADLFVDAYKSYNVQFIIETHSEYLVRKLQTIVAKKEVASSDCSLIYFYDADVKKRPLYTPQLKQIIIKEDGRLSDSFGTGFFDEADRLSMNLLSIKVDKDA